MEDGDDGEVDEDVRHEEETLSEGFPDDAPVVIYKLRKEVISVDSLFPALQIHFPVNVFALRYSYCSHNSLSTLAQGDTPLMLLLIASHWPLKEMSVLVSWDQMVCFPLETGFGADVARQLLLW